MDMKITRFINGKKISKGIDREFTIKEPIIADTIELVNRRLMISDNSYKKGQENA